MAVRFGTSHGAGKEVMKHLTVAISEEKQRHDETWVNFLITSSEMNNASYFEPLAVLEDKDRLERLWFVDEKDAKTLQAASGRGSAVDISWASP